MDILAKESIQELNKENMISDDLLNMMLDLINIYREKEFILKDQEKLMDNWKTIDPIIGDKFPKTFLKTVFFDHEYKSLLKKDIMEPNQEIPKSVTKILDHSIQLIDVRGLFWMISEKERIRSVLIISKLLTTYSLCFDKKEINLPKPTLLDTQFFKVNVSSFITQAIIIDYFYHAANETSYTMTNLVKLAKMGYALLLLQIAARVIYEQKGYYISNWKTTLSIPVLEDMVKNQNAELAISGLSIETSKRFIDGSLSYLRKAAGLVSLFDSLVFIKKDRLANAKILNKFSNRNFVLEPKAELDAFLKLFGWNIKNQEGEYNFFSIIEDAKEMDTEGVYGLKDFKDYLDDQCGLNEMDISFEKPKEENLEEEKHEGIDFFWSKVKEFQSDNPIFKHKEQNLSLIPNNLYLITLDFNFLLPKIPPTLAEFTKEYYKKDCSLCHKITKRGAVCLACQDYLCMVSCENGSKPNNADHLGNLSLHSVNCGAKSAVFICPYEGQLIYNYNGLSVEFPSPYVDKYGECYDEKTNRYETLNLKQEKYSSIRDHFLSASIADLVIRKRSNKSKVYRQFAL